MQKPLEFFIKTLIGATFIMPLVVIPSSFIFPFIVPKILIFRSLVLLMIGGYIILLVSNWEKYKMRLSPVNIVVALFFISFAISTFVGVDWYKSFWDNHERMLGLFTIFHYVIYYYVASSVVKEWVDWKWLLRIFLLAGGIVMILGIWQKFIDPEFLLNRSNVRVSATLGNPIYFSGYGLFLFFIAIILAVKEKTKAWQVFAGVSGMLGFVGIFIGGTRGTLLGLMVGLVVLCLSYIITLEGYKKIRQALLALVIVGVGLLGVLFVFRQTNFVSNIPTVGRLLNTSITGGTAHTRIMAWNIAVEGWREKPIFGHGPNNFYYVFNEHYKPEFLELGYGETWFDNAHSAVMNTLAVQGLFGLLLYIGLFVASLYVLWRGYFRKKIDPHIVSISSAFLVAHFVHNAFVFENPTSYLYFFFFLAFVNQISEARPQTLDKEKGHAGRLSLGLSIVVGLIILLFIYSTNINPAKANTSTLKAMKNLPVNQTTAIQFYEKAKASSSPHIDDIRIDFARAITEILPSLVSAKRTDTARELFNLAYSDLNDNLILHPLDIRVHILRAQLTQYGLQITKNSALIYEAEKMLEDALAKSPKRQQLQYMLSSVKLQLGKPQEAAQLLQESIENDPKISDGWWRLAYIYQQLGDVNKVKEVLEEAEKNGIKFSGQGQSVVSEILSNLEASDTAQ